MEIELIFDKNIKELKDDKIDSNILIYFIKTLNNVYIKPKNLIIKFPKTIKTIEDLWIKLFCTYLVQTYGKSYCFLNVSLMSLSIKNLNKRSKLIFASYIKEDWKNNE